MISPRYMAAALAGLAWLGSPANVAAQTACPHGTAAGSYGCGPDTQGGYQETRVYYDGRGAIAFSDERFKVYPVSQHGGTEEGVQQRAMDKCLADGQPADCRVLYWWHNGCTALATGNDEQQRTGMFTGFDNTYSTRRAKRNALQQCEQAGARNCTIYKLGRHTDTVCNRRGYRSQ